MTKNQIDKIIEISNTIKNNYSEIMFHQERFEERCYRTFTVEDDINDTVSILGAHKDFIREIIDVLRDFDF